MMGVVQTPSQQEATMLSIQKVLNLIKGNTAEFLPENIVSSLCRELQLSSALHNNQPLSVTCTFNGKSAQ